MESKKTHRIPGFVIFCIYVFFFPGRACAQDIILTRQNYYFVGDNFVKHRISRIPSPLTIGEAGKNQTWDFSNIDIKHISVVQDTFNVIEPFNTVFFRDTNVNYKYSNLCIYYRGSANSTWSNNYEYYSVNDSALSFWGDWANNGGSEKLYYSFSESLPELIFPLTYGKVFQNDFLSRLFDASGSGWHLQKGTSRAEADGTGTLILQKGEIILENCIRVKYSTEYTDSSIFGLKQRTNLYYKWYSQDKRGPVFEISYFLNVPRGAFIIL